MPACQEKSYSQTPDRTYQKKPKVHIDPEIDAMVFPLFLARELIFNNPPGANTRSYPPGTEARKVAYTQSMILYMKDMEERHGTKRGRAVAIDMDGVVRYVWRDDVWTQEEFDAAPEGR